MFYRVYAGAAAIVIASLVLFFLAFVLVKRGGAPRPAGPELWLVTASMWVGYFLAFVIVRAHVANRTWNHTGIAGHRLRSSLRARSLAGLYLVHTVAILASLGLAVPWAMVRMARYRAACTTLLAQGDLTAFVGDVGLEESATGAEAADVFGVDFGL